MTDKKTNSLARRIALINLILTERSAVPRPAHQQGHLSQSVLAPKSQGELGSRHLGDNEKQIVLSGFIKGDH